MKRFKKIFYFCDIHANDLHVAKQALSVCRNGQGSLGVWVSAPTLPAELAEYKQAFHEGLIARAKQQIILCCAELKLDINSLRVDYKLLYSTHTAIDLIKTVMTEHYDVVIKAADDSYLVDNRKQGYGALDMALLRKCPVPVWLCRPITQHRDKIKVAVAIDPNDKEDTEHKLSKQLLCLGHDMADDCDGLLNVVSCWEFELETVLRNSAWLKIANDDLNTQITQADALHQQALKDVVSAELADKDIQVVRLQGAADKCIPTFVESHNIDILVMGTVARTGIPGLLIGNTAESILRALSCTLLAVKPEGFISPVI